MKKFVKAGYWQEYYSYSFEALTLPAGSPGTLTAIVTRLDTDADFIDYAHTHVATNQNIQCLMSDDAYGRFLQNTTNLDIRTCSAPPLAGGQGGIMTNGIKPYYLPKPYYMVGGNTFTWQFADNANNGTNSIRLTMHGAKLRPGRAPWEVQQWAAEIPFFYVATAAIGANATASFAINVGTDAHFVVEQLLATRDGAALVSIKDAGSDRQWMDKSVHIDNLFGNSQYPHELPAPRFIARGSVIAITVQDLSGATNNVRAVMVGRKLYS